jgi:hypothetical protein
MMNKILLLGVTLFTLFSCQDNQSETTETSSAKAVQTGGISDIIRNPVTANSETVDTTLLAVMNFDTTTYNFGIVDQGAVVQHTFEFTNDGAVPLVISDVRSTCGCTVADWPREPIAPGKAGSIPVRFDTNKKGGIQSKPITITANTYPAKTTLYLNGRVEVKE